MKQSVWILAFNCSGGIIAVYSSEAAAKQHLLWALENQDSAIKKTEDDYYIEEHQVDYYI